MAPFRAAALLLVLAPLSSAFCAPRDAVAVLNRCGKPLKGDDTVLDDSVAGGHRTLKYQRGDLHFEKVALDGWSFTYGTHHDEDHLDAQQMAVFMPCLSAALADSLAPGPIQPISSATRIESSAKAEYKQLMLWVVAALVATGLILYLLSLRKRPEEQI